MWHGWMLRDGSRSWQDYTTLFAGLEIWEAISMYDYCMIPKIVPETPHTLRVFQRAVRTPQSVESFTKTEPET